MLDDNESTTEATSETAPARRRAAGRPAGPPAAVSFAPPEAPKKKAPAKKAAASDDKSKAESTDVAPAQNPPRKTGAGGAPTAAKKAPAKKAAKKDDAEEPKKAAASSTAAMFKAPEPGLAPARPKPAPAESQNDDDDGDDDDDPNAPKRRRRSRGGRRRSKGAGDDNASDDDNNDEDGDDNDSEDDGNGNTRRRRRRARAGEGVDGSPDDPENTVVRVRSGRTAEDEITGVAGSTRLEAKKQRRREGREAGRRRAPIVSEAEFLARRESVKREMVVRQRDDYTQIAVIEDNVLVEHYVARESQVSIIGNVYLGKVQNVLPSMEAAFVDIGAGRNAVLYAGEVDWTTLGNGKARKIEDALKPGQTILVQVSKDPIGQKGARLTSQISLPGRFLVLVPNGQTSGISRKLPENERTRLKGLLKEVLPENVGVIVRTAAEGATEDQLTRDVTALTARWEDIERKVAAGKAPDLLYSEPDLMIKVVRDLFNEDFNGLVVEGADAWDMIKGYIDHVAPDLAERVTRYSDEDKDAFTSYRLDEQIHKALERKVFLPSGGSLVIDRTEAMTVVDVNTGKYTGSGGNLEETVTKNNLEAAEEVVRQLRLRDIGGIIVVDFIDMVLESNRELVLRRLVECLGRDRTRHQVAEVTSLGLVQMTRKRIGTGLLESFSHECEHCNGRGVVIADAPVEPKKEEQRRGGRGGRGGGGNGGGGSGGGGGRGGAANGPGGRGGSRKNDDVDAKDDNKSSDDTKADNKPAAEDKADVKADDAPKNDAPKAEAAPAAEPAAPKKTARKRSASKPAGPPAGAAESTPEAPASSGETGPVLTSEGQAP